MKPAKEWLDKWVEGFDDEDNYPTSTDLVRNIQRDAAAAMRDAAVLECNSLLSWVEFERDARLSYAARLLGDRINSIDIDKLMEQP